MSLIVYLVYKAILSCITSRNPLSYQIKNKINVAINLFRIMSLHNNKNLQPKTKCVRQALVYMLYIRYVLLLCAFLLLHCYLNWICSIKILVFMLGYKIRQCPDKIMLCDVIFVVFVCLAHLLLKIWWKKLAINETKWEKNTIHPECMVPKELQNI